MYLCLYVWACTNCSRLDSCDKLPLCYCANHVSFLFTVLHVFQLPVTCTCTQLSRCMYAIHVAIGAFSVLYLCSGLRTQELINVPMANAFQFLYMTILGSTIDCINFVTGYKFYTVYDSAVLPPLKIHTCHLSLQTSSICMYIYIQCT